LADPGRRRDYALAVVASDLYGFNMLRQLLACCMLALVPAIDASNKAIQWADDAPKTTIHRADPTKPFEPVVIITKQPAYHDFYVHTLGDVAPEFQDVSTLWAGERVYIFVLAGNYAVSAANDVNLTFDLTIRRPDRKKKNAGSNLIIYQGKMDDPQTVPFPEKTLEFSTDPGDPTGEYTLVVTVHDRIGGEKRVVKKILQVIPFASAEPPDDFSADDWMMNYYRLPRPELALPALRAMSEKILVDNEGAWPPIIGFYGQLLANDPWLVPEFAEGMHQGTDHEMQAITRVLGYALRNASEPPAGVTPDDWAALAEARSEQWPDPDATLTDPSQLDMLWGRFFATGTFAPVSRIASTLAYYPCLGQFDELKKSGQKPAVIPPDVAKDLVLRSALWSLGSLAKQQPLVHNYGEWILARENLDSTSQLLLAKALGHEIKDDASPAAP
jgi:hypothetical protein